MSYLKPDVTEITIEQVEQVIHDLILGLTDIPGDLIRPVWQEEQPQQPTILTNWCAFGFTEFRNQWLPIKDYSSGTQMTMMEFFTCALWMYGPQAVNNCALIRDSLFISRNREALLAVGTKFIDTSAIRRIPELINTKMYERAYMEIELVRGVYRNYNIQEITGGSVALQTATSTRSFDIGKKAIPPSETEYFRTGKSMCGESLGTKIY